MEMVKIKFTKLYIRMLWQMIERWILTDKVEKSNHKRLIEIMDRFVIAYDNNCKDSKHEYSLLFSYDNAVLLWEILKVTIEEGIVKDPQEMLIFSEAMTAIAIELERYNTMKVSPNELLLS